MPTGGASVYGRLIPLSWSRWPWLVVLIVGLLSSVPVQAIDWSFFLQRGQIVLALPDVHSEGWQVTGARADVVHSLEANHRNLIVHFKSGSRLYAERIAQDSAAAVQLNQVQVDLGGVTLSLNFSGTGSLAERSTVTGKVGIHVAELQHPQFKSQGWEFAGAVKGSLADLNLDGQLRSHSGLVLDAIIRSVVGEFLAAHIAITLTGENVQEVMPATLANWPEMLEFSGGKIQAEAKLRIEPDTPLALDSQFGFESVDGLMNSTAVTELNGQLWVSLENNVLTARVSDLSIGKINSGIGIGPVSFLADYRASQSGLLAGELNIQQATAEFLGGRLRIAPRTIDLSEQPWGLPIDAYDVSLAELLQVYPAEGVSGSGKLTARIPVSLGVAGLAVVQGQIEAAVPGGILRLPSERLQAMLGSRHEVEPVVKALQNFQYSVLKSTVDYDNEGRLALGLRLEGKEAGAENGQPIVVNLNIEEDIPALLTSLQLSGRVNEAVTERVRQRLQQTEQEAMP
ncbi:YdbH domain-containing protein [Marinobacter sp.]|uniref:intermembrane phospholipid transport protein YdbH family protein n=1 Tax=Marinobacter sp. TaxID=50741 RepID=UPI0035641E69